MDTNAQLSRTPKGQDEIFNHGHTVRPRCRQILFAIGNGITFGALRDKLPNAELETLLNDLQQGGFIEVSADAASTQSVSVPSTPVPAVAASPVLPVDAGQPASGLENARNHVLDVLAALAGTKSPAYRRMSEVQDVASFKEALAMCRKMIAAVASPHQAAAMEIQALERLGS